LAGFARLRMATATLGFVFFFVLVPYAYTPVTKNLPLSDGKLNTPD
jgi:hypothetical protein